MILCMILTALPLSVSADVENALPFIDVADSAWYYNAVSFVYGNGYFSGLSDAEFGPSVPMNRAMFVTVLSKLDDAFDPDDYDGQTDFEDVKIDDWFSKAVQWAVEKSITTGTDEKTFSPKSEITREQLAVMMYAFLRYLGKPIDSVIPSDLAKFGDVDDMHDWAKDAVKFMSHYGLMSGKSVKNGAPMFDPLGKATRAEVAQILMTGSNVNFTRAVPINDLRLNGNPISEYVIVYGETGTKYRNINGQKIAEELRGIIAEATGISLEIYKDSDRTEVSDKEIRIGMTDREDVTPVDRTGLDVDSVYYELRDNTLIIASNEEFGGTMSAVYDFVTEQIGYDCYGNISVITPVEKVNVPAGVSKNYTPLEVYRMNYQQKFNAYYPFHNDMEGMKWREAMLMHTLPEFARDDYIENLYGRDYWGYHVDHHKDPDPCLTDEHNLDNIIKSIKALIQKRTNEGSSANLIWVTQCDGLYNQCRCENCVKVYRTYGRCATYVHCYKYIADAIRDEYPDWTILGMAYTFTLRPPKTSISDEEYAEFLATYPESKYVPEQDMTLPDNCAVCVCTDGVCMAHAIGDPNCKHPAYVNSNFLEWMKDWKKISNRLWIWDYVNPDNYEHQAFPNIYQMYQNFQIYNSLGVEGSYVLGNTGYYGDFGELRSYLCSKLQWQYEMTWDEYSEYINSFLEAYYGPGWTYIREYIDLMQALSYQNDWNIWGGHPWDRVVTVAQYADNLDYLMGLWQKAIDLANMDGNYDQELRCKRTGSQIIYAQLMVEYDKFGTDKTPEYQAILDNYKAIMAETELNPPKDYGGDPNNWKMSSD